MASYRPKKYYRIATYTILGTLVTNYSEHEGVLRFDTENDKILWLMKYDKKIIESERSRPIKFTRNLTF